MIVLIVALILWILLDPPASPDGRAAVLLIITVLYLASLARRGLLG